MAAPAVLWRRLRGPGLVALLARMFDRNKDRGGRTPLFLLAPLVAPTVPQVTPQRPPLGCVCPRGAHRFQWIGNLVPEFGISSSDVKILSTPSEFYQSMKTQIKAAKKRIVMASLYLGTGSLEQELVDAIEETLRSPESSDLRVSILLDFTRGSRGRKNSRTMLLPLLRRFPDQVRVSLFHTPNLRGLLRLLTPERFNETIGLQHMKVYLFDDNVILSGANLSDSYFTNRQDRYVMLQGCPDVADFFGELVSAVGDVSLQLRPDDSVGTEEGMEHPYRGNKAKYCDAANQRVMGVIERAQRRQCEKNSTRFRSGTPASNAHAPDTWVYPLVQMKPFGVQIDELVTETLLTEAERGDRLFLTTGYFNLTQGYMDLVLGTRADYSILLAAPEVNGFFGARGVAGAIPAAYVHIERQFYNELCRQGQQRRVKLLEYFRELWTFHAKGLWLYPAGAALPCLTLIGSPNFGYRSVHRDLEAQIALVTENQELQQQLHQEQQNLYTRSGEVTPSTFRHPSRHVKLWVKLVTPLIKNFF
ncbi:CDP-diacylglycerol--glycerol-3-phosphate 3-phosphatidyltransferase, mitochondrial [Spea bombifrons]|uniref:CDP-diacylglycerol--glycerol-3-phosphate 3-phosphatidyltransferase, mitochondrial n=1 Tax=Spea bombifrons TaxID=233779 RepID=UPI002349CAED|nr:CDP-diacylglycerol--glycerol-3-phosphate 3-phosphatidyltransferase, mitochondrial [Spea bombifrons]XP_053309023.1 CDP-diacylglycerol--glycerol-3-phosphate 3-phosphatidyltransferase, mitochondrial [Spea bombifrons]XP_053309024.1 CDP-diacylglycerol--glycerol-3-phosphate 3-phosphatidyltransferase, mitochondrial [Spea bombifrons]